MGFADEEYQKAKYQKEHGIQNEEESKEDEIQIEYERRFFIDGKISMEVPKDCVEVPKDTIQFIFYGENKPEYVIQTKSGEAAYGYNYTELEFGDENVFQFTNFAAKVLESAGPGVKIRKVKNDKITNEKTKKTYSIGKIEFTSKGFDGGIFNTMFFIILENRLLINFIVVPSAEYSIRKKMIAHMADSFEVEEKIEDGDNNL